MSTLPNQYPLWKYLLLLVILAVAFLYAAPNLYGDDPAIEIATDNTIVLDSGLAARTEAILQQKGIAFKTLSLENDKLIVRLKSLDSQLPTKEMLQTALGEHYTVSVSLLPATPTWLNSLGATPMKLGLDLRGGVHFLLQVDFDSVLKSHLQSDLRVLADSLQKSNLRYSGVAFQPPAALLISFREASTRDAALTQISRNFVDYAAEAVSNPDLSFGIKLTLTPTELKNLRDYTLSQTIQVLNNRINALGVAESIVARQGLDRISVDLPGVQDTTQASQILGGNATLEMRLVDETAEPASLQQGIVPLGSTLYRLSNGEPIALKNQVILTGEAIKSASAGFSQNTAEPSVSIRASGPQINDFHRITGENVGKRMGIVLVDVKNTPMVVEGKTINRAEKVQTVISAARINSALGASFEVTGLGSLQNARNLAIQLRSGTAPANLYPIQQLLVGPSLGKTNIQYGLISIVVGFAAIVLFMTFYYRLFGLIANAALTMNLLLIVSLMSLVGFTLSLPGMAAMVLTVGMAVDANVLIFERIREELRQGTPPQAAITAGYERAFSTIMDANITTLIVAVVLFAIATSAIKAFAITLIIGLLTSLLTAIMGTRAIVNLIYGGRSVKKLSIGI